MNHQFSTGSYRIIWEEIEGLCVCPVPSSEPEEKTISLSPRLRGKRLLDVAIHEALHAENPRAKEELSLIHN